MKILFLGQLGTGQTSQMRMRALERLGHAVRGVDTSAAWTRVSWLSRQLQRRLERGPVIDEINHSVQAAARSFRPDLLWAERQQFLCAEVLDELKKIGIRLIHFTPDPYFSLSWKQSRIMNRALRHFDVLVYCKSYESADYERLRKPVVYMPLGYCDEVHRPLGSLDAHWQSEVASLGGWEPHREYLLRRLAIEGFDVKIWGFHWDFLLDGRWTPRRHLILRQIAGGQCFSFHCDEQVRRTYQGVEVYGDDYARALTGAKIGVGFLRRVCPDQHTTRTFEIPACGSMLLAERTDEHCQFFAEGTEAEFFDSPEELVDKVRFYCANEPARKRIAEAGYARCRNSGYAYIERLKQALADLEIT